MKAITLWQPWASLVAAGAKRVETRSWPTDHRGPLAIHASAEAAHLSRARDGSMRAALIGARQDPDDLPLGRIVALCFLSAVVPTEGPLPELPVWEFEFGDFSPRRYAWFLAEIRTLERPVKVAGAQRLWDWNPRGNARIPTRRAHWTIGNDRRAPARRVDVG